MNISGQQRFPFSAETVFNTYGDPKHIEAKQQFLGARNINIRQCDLSDSNLDLDVVREVPAEAPAMLKKFIAEWNSLTQVEHWQGDPEHGYTARLDISIEGVPVKITGEIDLKPEGDGCCHNATVNFECKIPLVGKKLAEFVASKSKEQMDNEFAFVADYLQANA